MIDYNRPLLLIGSCFTENIGERLKRDLFDVVVNPTGTLYNPLSIADAIDSLIDEREFDNGDLFNHEGLWRSFSHHSAFASSDPVKALNKMNRSREVGSEKLRNAGTLIVTWGSSTAYCLRATEKIVANCHKLPAAQFEVIAVETAEIVVRWERTLAKLSALNPKLKVIFTVSPIRHKAYGLAGNTLNKARLIDAAHQLCQSHGAIYFPSYEIMLDDLRDYRFYAADMIHPSDVACDYIYEIFTRSFLSEETIVLAERSRRLSRRLSHRPLGDNSENLSADIKIKIELINQHISQFPATAVALTPILNDLHRIANS